MKNENQNIEWKSIWKDEDWLMIYNNGDLPRGWTVDTLKIKHTSEPANPDIAKAFFRAGYIETWGRGTVNIVEYCTQAGLPEPVFEGKWGGIAIIFTKHPDEKPWEVVGESSEKDLEKDLEKLLSINEKRIFEIIFDNPKITTRELSSIIKINERNIRKNIDKLKNKGLIKRIGSDRGGYWKVIN